MKKGFTLVEIVAVLVILGIIGVVTIPTISTILKEDSEKIYQNQLKQIEKAAKDWAYSNTELLPTKDNPYVTVQLSTLQQTGYLPLNIKNPKDDSLIETATITIKFQNNNYVFEVTNINNADTKTEFTNESPRLILNGSSLEYVELNSEYVEKGVIAQDYLGNAIDQSRVQIIYKYLETEVSGITTNQFRTFTVTYIVNDTVNGEEYSSKIMKTVIIRDTQAPELVVGDTITVTLEEAKTINLLDGVVVSDNDTNSVSVSKVEVSGFDRVYGEKIVTYEICDNSNNCTTKRRIIKIVGVYVDEVLNGADPELDSGMIPIEITTDGIIKKADLKSEWYNYTNKKWANAVLVSDETRQMYKNASPGTVISASDIKAYYVWVPRYKYQIFTDVNNLEQIGSISGPSQYVNKAQIINVVFEDKSTSKSAGTNKGEWLTHPAFTFGNEELNGIWVGKFETTGTANEPTILGYDSRYTVTNNITSLRNQKVSTQFATSQKINYGLTSLEASLLKNSEWGAVTYLTTSNYGQGKTEVMINNSSVYNTGCAATVAPTIGYGGYLEQTNHTEGYYAGCENEWYTSLGQKASTTGNLYGIYDISGGAWEYVMGVMEDSLGSGIPASGRNNDSNSGFTGALTYDSTIKNIIGVPFPNSKYFDIYKYDTSVTVYAGRGHLGDATYELDGFSDWIDQDRTTRYHSGWNQDYASFVDNSVPWFTRGGYWADGSSAGIFAFGNSGLGWANSIISFHSVLR